jgi:hypothetical protein
MKMMPQTGEDWERFWLISLGTLVLGISICFAIQKSLARQPDLGRLGNRVICTGDRGVGNMLFSLDISPSHYHGAHRLDYICDGRFI